MLQRILLIVAMLFVIWRIVTAWGRRLVRNAPGADRYSRYSHFRRGPRGSEPSPQPEELVACSTCGTYVPARRALSAGDELWFCGTACRDAHQLPADRGSADGRS